MPALLRPHEHLLLPWGNPSDSGRDIQAFGWEELWFSSVLLQGATGKRVSTEPPVDWVSLIEKVSWVLKCRAHTVEARLASCSISWGGQLLLETFHSALAMEPPCPGSCSTAPGVFPRSPIPDTWGPASCPPPLHPEVFAQTFWKNAWTLQDANSPASNWSNLSPFVFICIAQLHSSGLCMPAALEGSPQQGWVSSHACENL